ncbi:MAG: YncE family protein, partial [Gemmatimonadetes bacterium]|nr:YncE family protein [Gemmatimonadota bacterium]
RLVVLVCALGLAACETETSPRPDREAEADAEVRLYVADRYEGVFQLDPATLAILDTIWTDPRPHGLVASPDGRWLFITVETTHELLKVDVRTNEIVARTNVGPVPNEPTVSRDGRHVFVPQRRGDQTTIVDTESMTVVKMLPAGREQHNAYTSKDGRHVYVTAMSDSLIAVIDPASLEIDRRIPVGGIPRPIAFTANDSLAYVALSGLIGFITVDLTTDRIIDRLELPIPPGTPPPLLDTYTHGVLLTPDERELWLAIYATDRVLAYTLPGKRPLADLVVGEGPHWFTLHPDGEPLYVTLERAGQVAAIHRGLREVMMKQPAGQGPTRILAFRTPVP